MIKLVRTTKDFEVSKLFLKEAIMSFAIIRHIKHKTGSLNLAYRHNERKNKNKISFRMKKFETL